MSRGIIQTAIGNQQPLELVYREPSSSVQESSLFKAYFASSSEELERMAALSFDEVEPPFRVF